MITVVVPLSPCLRFIAGLFKILQRLLLNSCFIVSFVAGFCNYVPPSSEQPQTDTDGTMESNTKSAFAENNLFETSDNIVQKR